MWKAAVFIACLALLIVAVNMMAQYRAENELVMRLCSDQQRVVSDLRALLLDAERGGTAAIKETRSSMIAAKLLFILPQRGDEADADYLARVETFLTARCAS